MKKLGTPVSSPNAGATFSYWCQNCLTVELKKKKKGKDFLFIATKKDKSDFIIKGSDWLRFTRKESELGERNDFSLIIRKPVPQKGGQNKNKHF